MPTGGGGGGSSLEGEMWICLRCFCSYLGAAITDKVPLVLPGVSPHPSPQPRTRNVKDALSMNGWGNERAVLPSFVGVEIACQGNNAHFLYERLRLNIEKGELERKAPPAVCRLSSRWWI